MASKHRKNLQILIRLAQVLFIALTMSVSLALLPHLNQHSAGGVHALSTRPVDDQEPLPKRSPSVSPHISNVVTLEDFDDIITRVDLGVNDFSGNMGIISDTFGQTSLICEGDSACVLRFEWDFTEGDEVFTGIFLSLFGLKETQITTDGLTTQTITFPEHYLNLDQVDGLLNEPGGARQYLTLCTQLTYSGTEELKLRTELKDTQGGLRFTRLTIPGLPDSQTHCWDFRNVYADSTDLSITRTKELVFIVERRHVGDGVVNPVSGTIDIDHIWFTTDKVDIKPANDEELLDLLERRAYQYFLDWSSRKPESMGIPQDRSSFGDLLTVGGIGFGLPAHIIAAERGWISRAEAATRTVQVLRILDNSAAFGYTRTGQIGYKGWFYHFLGVNGRRKLNFDFPETPAITESLNTVELSAIDTGLAVIGILATQSYFTDTDAIESEIYTRAQSIYDRVDWSFMLEPGLQQFYLGWKPNEEYEGPPFEIPDADMKGNYSGTISGSTILSHTLDYYTDEALIVILLATGAITDPVPPEVYSALKFDRQDGLVRTYPGALFTYQFLHAFFDARSFRPCGPVGWYENSRQATFKAIDYAETNPESFSTFGSDAWGISAAEGPFDGYHAYGAPPLAITGNPELDGTVTYYGMLNAAGFGDDLRQQAISALRAAWQRGHWHSRFGLPDAFNNEVSQAISTTATLTDALRQNGPWSQRALFAIDQGPMLLHLENARSGLIWDLTAQNPNIQRALGRLAALDHISLEAEDGEGFLPSQIMLRSNASHQRTVLLQSGESLTLPFVITNSGQYTMNIRYSNDNFGPLETVTVTLDGESVGSFLAQDTGNGGFGWNVFTSTVLSNPVNLQSGSHNLAILAQGGDGLGVEIDVVSLEVVGCFHPALAVTKYATPNTVWAGTPLTYTIYVANTGNITLTAYICH